MNQLYLSLLAVVAFLWLCGYANGYSGPFFNPAPLPNIAAVDTLAVFRAGTPAEYARALQYANPGKPGLQEAMRRFDR